MQNFGYQELRSFIKANLSSRAPLKIALKDFSYTIDLSQLPLENSTHKNLFGYFEENKKIELNINKLFFDKIEKDSAAEKTSNEIIDVAYSRYATVKDRVISKPRGESKLKVAGSIGENQPMLVTFSANYGQSSEIFSLFEPVEGNLWFHEKNNVPVSNIGYYSTLALHPIFDLKSHTSSFIDKFVLAIFSRILIKKAFQSIDLELKKNGVEYIYVITLPKLDAVFKDCGIFLSKMNGYRITESEYTSSITNNFKRYWKPEDPKASPGVYLGSFANGPIEYTHRNHLIHIDEDFEYLTVTKIADIQLLKADISIAVPEYKPQKAVSLIS
jgi:hypothetical protein